MKYPNKKHPNTQQNIHTGCGDISIPHKAKKAMGQNFLKSKEALFMMCEAGDVNYKDIIVEIGPGKGVLTEKLLEKADLVIAIEKDKDLIEILKERFANEIDNYINNPQNNQQNIHTGCGIFKDGGGEIGRDREEGRGKIGKLLLLNEDILNFDPKKQGLIDGDYKIIANIPYNITGLIIRRFLSEVTRPNTMTLLVQKEVAERIVARDNKESILSLSVKAYGTPKYIMKVHKRFFSPSPKVDSAIISINNISNSLFKDINKEALFFKLIKTGFAHKRKVLRKNLEELYADMLNTENTMSKIDKMFEKLEINPKTRAEDVTFNKWIELSNLIDN